MNPRLLYRLIRGELLHGGQRLLILGIALLIGITALVAISGFSARVELALQNRSAELLGGQIRISAQRDLGAWMEQLPAHLQPQLSQMEFRTMAIAGENMRLVELKTVAAGYPLLGDLLIRGRGTSHGPEPGTVFVEPALLEQLGVAVGDHLSVGYAQLEIAGVIEKEPDRVAGVFSIGPRVLMEQRDLPQTRLLQPGSRYRHSLLYRLDSAEVAPMVTELTQRLPPWATLESGANGLETTRNLMKQASDFLHMLALAGLILATAAAAISTHSLVEQRTLSVATLKAMGATRGQILASYLALVMIVAALSGVLASALGFLLQGLLPSLLREFLPDELPPPRLIHFAQGVITSLALCALFAILPFYQLASTSPARVFQQSDNRPVGLASGLALALTLLVVGLLFYWITGNLALVLWSSLGLAGLLLAFFAAQALIFPLLARLAPGRSLPLRYALGGLLRSSGRSRFAISALALGILALLVPALIQSDLIRHWQNKVPQNAPNRFLIDIQPHQKEGVADLLRENGVQDVELWPSIRARLTHIRNQPVAEYAAANPRGQRLLERENNLTWRREPPENLHLLAGKWWPAEGGPAEISVEEEWAKSLGVGLGDRLAFSLEGREFAGVITSVRRVEWESMRPNFFLIFPPAALQELPATWLTSYRADGEREGQVRKALIGQFPNLTVIDLEQVVTRMQEIISRVSQAIGYLGGFTLLAGLAVLMAVVVADRQATRQETALLRMVGATDAQVKAIFTWRFLLLGGLSALLGVIAALICGQLLAQRFLHIGYQPNALLLGIVLVGSAALVLVVGRAGTRGALQTPPLSLLRE